jgi:hypothetical protein
VYTYQYGEYFQLVCSFISFNHNLRQPIPKRQVCQDAVDKKIEVGRDQGVLRSPSPEHSPHDCKKQVYTRRYDSNRRLFTLAITDSANDDIKAGYNEDWVAVLIEFGRTHHVVVFLDLFVFHAQRQ